MAETKDFDVIRVCRSDGADTGPGYWPVTAPASNAAKKTSTDKAPRAKPQMTRLPEDDPRFVEWRVKLGILLKQELSPTPDEGNAWYVPFPRGYWLYERSKHLWVSGYPIKAKLFKTPQEFALHMIWLLSGSKDYKDCCCVHCNIPSLPKQPSSAGDDTPTLTSSESPAKPPAKVTPVPLPPLPGQAQSMSPAPTQRLQAAQATTRASASPGSGTPASSSARQTPVLAPAQAQPPQPQQQPLVPAQMQPQPVTQWSLKAPLLFRVGELIWYVGSGGWRLGVIRKIGTTINPDGYDIIPLGYDMRMPVFPDISTPVDMRPYHAFSVPPITMPELKGKFYDDVPWPAMLHATDNNTNKKLYLDIEASKLAATKVDSSYSLWSPMPEDPTGKTTAYYGCYLGTERVEIGDSLRIKPPPEELDVATDKSSFGLRAIFTSTDYPGGLLFRGHVYILVRGDASNAVPPDQLPVALSDEINWRNSISPPWSWVLVRENYVLQEKSICGRFYPTPRLLPFLYPPGFNKAVRTRQLDDRLFGLNARMDCSIRYVGRCPNRMATLGEAAPPNVALALEPYVHEDAAAPAPLQRQ